MAMPASWRWVPDTLCYLHDSGDYVVWEQCVGGWVGYSRLPGADHREDRTVRRIGPFETPQEAALRVLANQVRLSVATGGARRRRFGVVAKEEQTT
jgi:hypothetical protein